MTTRQSSSKGTRKSGSPAKRAAANGANSYEVPTRRTLTVRLEGETYHVKVPKMYKIASLMGVAKTLGGMQGLKGEDATPERLEEVAESMKEIMDMVTGLFSDSDGTQRRESSRDRFRAALEDDDSDIDIDVAGFLIQRVVEAASEGRGQQFPT
ncbi:MAG: hypothetical protein ACRDQD_08210 [Nocardioidaceae bacterium]